MNTSVVRAPLFILVALLVALVAFTLLLASLEAAPAVAASPSLVEKGIEAASVPQQVNADERLSGAAGFSFIDDSFDFQGPSAPSCGEELAPEAGSTALGISDAPSPALASGRRNFVPTLSDPRGEVTPTVAALNEGQDLSIVGVLFFGDEGPLGAVCSGLVNPGASFLIGPEMMPAGAESAVLYSFDDSAYSTFTACQRLREIDTVAEYQIFHQDYLGGGIPSGERFAVQVQRTPAGQAEEQGLLTTMYNAVSDRVLGPGFMDGTFGYTLPRVRTAGDAETTVYIQNSMPESATYAVSLREDGSGAETAGPTGSIPAGGAVTFNASAYAGSSFSGSLSVTGTQPLAVVGDLAYGPFAAASTPAFPLSGPMASADSARQASAALLYEPGWDAAVSVLNASGTSSQYTITFRSATGDPLSADTVFLEAGESESIQMSDPGYATARAGAVHVEGEEPVAATVQQSHRDGSGDVQESFAQNLEPILAPFDNTGGGAGLLGLPLAGKADAENGRGTEILRSNRNPYTGLTSVAVYLYDSAGLLDVHCQLLEPLETRLIPVDFPAAGRGSALSVIISGTRTTQQYGYLGSDYRAYALSASAIQRNTPPERVDDAVSLRAGRNDAALAYKGEVTVQAVTDVTLSIPKPLHFPVLNAAMMTGTAHERLEIQAHTTGISNTRVGLVFFAGSHFLGRHLTGEIGPGQTVVLDAVLPEGAESAVAYSLDADNEPAIARFSGIDTPDEYAAFHFDYDERLITAGRPLGGVATRAAPVDEYVLFSGYEALSGRDDLGVADPVFGAGATGFGYHLPQALAADGYDTILYVQNAGIRPTAVEVSFFDGPASPLPARPSGEREQQSAFRALATAGERRATTRVDALQPGESVAIRPAETMGEGFRGGVLLRSSEPLAVVGDLFSAGTLASAPAHPIELNYTYDPDFAYFTVGSQVAYAPLLYPPEQGWRTTVQVQNLSKVLDAKVQVAFYDGEGALVETASGFVPPGGAAPFTLAPGAFAPDENPSSSGWVQVTSEEFWQPGTPLALAPNVVATVHAVKENEADCFLEAVSYRTFSEQEVFDWPEGSSGEQARLELASVLKGDGNFASSSQIALANVNPNLSHATLTATFSSEGAQHVLPPITLAARESVLLDLEELAAVPDGFQGSLLLDVAAPQADQEGGPGIVAVGVNRALDLLPNETCTTIAAPTLLSPADGATTAQNAPTFDWTDVAGAAEYQWQVDDDAGFGSATVDVTTAESEGAPPSPLDNDLYFWRVRAGDGAGQWSAWSEVWELTVEQWTVYVPTIMR